MVIELLHQTAKTENLDEFSKENKKLLIKHHPSYTYKLWTDIDLKNLLNSYDEFSNFREYWDLLEGIQRSDIGRYMFIYIHGGLYSDTDVTFTKPISNYKTDKNLLFSYSNPILFGKGKKTNYVIYSKVKKHPFFLDLFKEIDQRIRSKNDPIFTKKVPFTTGCDVISYVFENSKNNSDVGVFPKDFIVDKTCSFTTLSPLNIASHSSSTVRNVKDSWINKSELELLNSECKLREYMGTSGNFSQFPILATLLYLSILLFVLFMIFIIFNYF